MKQQSSLELLKKLHIHISTRKIFWSANKWNSYEFKPYMQNKSFLGLNFWNILITFSQAGKLWKVLRSKKVNHHKPNKIFNKFLKKNLLVNSNVSFSNALKTTASQCNVLHSLVFIINTHFSVLQWPRAHVEFFNTHTVKNSNIFVCIYIHTYIYLFFYLHHFPFRAYQGHHAMKSCQTKHRGSVLENKTMKCQEGKSFGVLSL